MKHHRLAAPLAFRRTAVVASLSPVALVLSMGVASAQPAPAPLPPPPAGELPPVETVPPTEPAPVEAPIVAPAEPAVTEAPVEAPKKKEEGLPAHLKYDKGIVFESDDESFELKLSFRNQLRFEAIRTLEEKQADGSDAEFLSHFQIPRARLQAEGHVWGKANRYKLELGLGDKGSFSFVKDLIVDRALAPKVWLRLGQWKRPFNRQELVSDFSSVFNERASTSEFTGGGRDMGIAIHNDYEKSPNGLEWVVGVFNGFNGGSDRPLLTVSGCSANATTGAVSCATPGAPSNFPTDFGPTAVARVGYNIGGIKGYSEGDLEGGGPRLAVGASYKIDLADFDKGKAESYGKTIQHGAQVDALFKFQGLDVLGGLYLMKTRPAGGAETGDAKFGGLLQAGYFVLPKQVQVAARVAFVPLAKSEDRREVETRGAINWYWKGHAWKLATDFGYIKPTGATGAGVEDKGRIEIRSMAQLTL